MDPSKNSNLKNVDRIIKRTLEDQYFQKWNSQLSNSSKGLNYRIFKSEVKLEPYLTILPQKQRISLFHFRTGNHRLPVEIGRWRNSHLPYEDRKCNECQLNEIGDEFHYMFICPCFASTRKRVMPRHYYYRPNVMKFQELFSSESRQLLISITTLTSDVIKHFTARNGL